MSRGEAGGPAMPGRWLHPADVDPAASERLFFFHHSGGSTSLYGEWLAMLPTDLAGQGIQLPGRQERRGEPPFDDFDPLVAAVAGVVGAELDGRPYALFGHSMGALLAYRVAVALGRGGWAVPALVAVSGWAPAGFRQPARGQVDRLADAEIMAAMHELGSVPAEISNDPDLLTQTVRAMRADSAACASYRDDRAVVRCPIVAYSGREDPLGSPASMQSWADRSPRYLGNRVFPGGHFFIRQHATEIVTDLVRLLRNQALLLGSH